MASGSRPPHYKALGQTKMAFGSDHFSHKKVLILLSHVYNYELKFLP